MFHFCMANVRAAKSPPTSISCRFELFVTSHGGHSSDQKEIQHGVTGEEEERWKIWHCWHQQQGELQEQQHTEGVSMHLFPKDEEVRTSDENGLNSFNSVDQISSERQSTVYI